MLGIGPNQAQTAAGIALRRFVIGEETLQILEALDEGATKADLARRFDLTPAAIGARVRVGVRRLREFVHQVNETCPGAAAVPPRWEAYAAGRIKEPKA